MLRYLIPLLLWPIGFLEGNGAPGAGGGGDAGGEGGTGEGSGAPPPKPGTGKPDADAGDKEPMIPKARLDEVLRENKRLKDAEDKRQRDALQAQGQHEELARKEKDRGDELAESNKALGRRLAFVEAATGRVSNVQLAAKLAAVDGLLADVEVDENGAVTKGDVGKIIDTMLGSEEYAFLKPGTPTTGPRTGDPVGGAGSNPVDVTKLSSEEKVNRGLEQAISGLPAHRQGLLGRTG